MSLSHMGTVAKIVAASMGVEVVFDASADTASTDGTRITIPTSLIGNGDAHAAILMRGFIAHEGVGHIRHTDMAAWSAFVQDASPLGKSILNIIVGDCVKPDQNRRPETGATKLLFRGLVVRTRIQDLHLIRPWPF